MSEKNRVFDALAGANGAVKAKTIVFLTGLKNALVQYHLRKLILEGRVVQVGRGMYQEVVQADSPVETPAGENMDGGADDVPFA